MKIARMSESDMEELRRRARLDKSQRLMHLIFCYETMFENACDPNSSVLEFKPFDMIIFCPQCKTQHIDEPDPSTCMDCGRTQPIHDIDDGVCEIFVPWTNPPHRKHRCSHCNHVFAVTETLKTNGVKELPV